MGRGASKGGGGGGSANKPANTPSGMTLDDLMKLPEDQRYDALNDILDNPNIKVPDYLDSSDTTKLIYALGMNNKPTVVSDSQLDSMSGRELFRTIYETGSMPPPSTDAVADQIRNGDYTHMSGKGGSLHGRAIYFATDFSDSAGYGWGEQNAMIIRGKLNSNANIRSEGSLQRQMYSDSTFDNSRLNKRLSGTDAIAAYALTHGVDGWYNRSYTMMVNRGALTMSSQNKRVQSGRTYYYSWNDAVNA